MKFCMFFDCSEAVMEAASHFIFCAGCASVSEHDAHEPSAFRAQKSCMQLPIHAVGQARLLERGKTSGRSDDNLAGALGRGTGFAATFHMHPGFPV